MALSQAKIHCLKLPGSGSGARLWKCDRCRDIGRDLALDLFHLGAAYRMALQPLAETQDRIFLFPILDFPIGPVSGRLEPRVSRIPVRLALEQRRTLAGSGLRDQLTGLVVDIPKIHAVGDHARDAVGLCARGDITEYASAVECG